MPKPSILIVDNDDFLAGIYARKFEQDGWNVRVVGSFEEAKKIWSKKTPRAVLLEPDIDQAAAETAVKELRVDPKTTSVPIVILSGIGEKAEIQRLRKAGVDAYLLKGHFVPSEVVRKVKAMVTEKK